MKLSFFKSNTVYWLKEDVSTNPHTDNNHMLTSDKLQDGFPEILMRIHDQWSPIRVDCGIVTHIR